MESFAEWNLSDLIDLTLDEKVDVFVSQVFGGLHRVRKCEKCGHYWQVIPHGTLATYDDDKLTRIVIASHELGLRAEIDNNGMRGLKIMLHNRSVRTGRVFDRHPTLDTVMKG